MWNQIWILSTESGSGKIRRTRLDPDNQLSHLSHKDFFSTSFLESDETFTAWKKLTLDIVGSKKTFMYRIENIEG